MQARAAEAAVRANLLVSRKRQQAAEAETRAQGARALQAEAWAAELQACAEERLAAAEASEVCRSLETVA